ncbi:MAG: hypothetical protein K2L49_05115 [Muribaculaceae bacterium]|nr:hypothetical protein [Muribaculaceae bacterium]
MKKLLILLAVAIIASLSLTSCNNNGLSADEKAELISNVKQAIAESRAKCDSSVSTIDMDKAVITLGNESYETTVNDSISDGEPIEVNISVNDKGFGSHIVEIFGVIFIFGGPFIATILIIWLCLRHATARRRGREQLIAMAIERGYALPDGFYETTPTKSRLQSGLVWLMWGIGLVIVMTCLGSLSLGTIGLIPLLVGVAKLITYYVEDRPSAKNDSESDNEQSLM